MRSFPVVNVRRRMGQPTEFEILNDQQILSICKTVEVFNEWKDWADTPTGDRYMRDAISAAQSILNQVPPGFQRGAAQEIEKYCPGSTDLIGFLNVAQPGTPPAIPPTQEPVATGPTSRTYPPPPPPTAPPVASVDRYIPYQPPPPPQPVATGQPPMQTVEYSPVTTGSEAPPPVETPTPQQTMPPAPPPVASVGEGCFYVIGQGYSWGPRPPGGESTGLNKVDCQNLIVRDREVRGLPVQTGQVAQTSQVNPQTPENVSNYNPGSPAAPATPGGVASVDCRHLGPYAYWDGRQCRPGTMNQSGGSLVSSAMNFGPSGGSMPAGNVAFGGEGYSSGGAPGAFSMAGRRRFRVVNL